MPEQKIIQKLNKKTQNKKSGKLINITDYHFRLKQHIIDYPKIYAT